MSTAQHLTLDELEDAALRLPPESRAELVESLLASFIGPDSDVQREWLLVTERRRRELVEGQVRGIPAAEAFAQARARLRARREIDAELTRAYRGKADELLAEIGDLLDHYRSGS